MERTEKKKDTTPIFRALTAALVAGGLLMASTIAPDQAQASDQLDAIKERGALRIAGVVYRPFIFRTPAGEYQGIETELLSGLAEKLGVELEFVDAEWSTAVAGLGTDKWDIVPSLCNTEERRQAIDFSDSYVTVGPVLAILSDNSEINSVEDANDSSVVIAVAAGGFSEKVANEAFPEAELKAFTTGGQDQAILEVLTGRVDATVVDTPVAVRIITAAHGDKMRFLPGPDEAMDVRVCAAAYGIAKGADGLRGEINAYLSEIRDNGRLEEIKATYMSEEYMSD